MCVPRDTSTWAGVISRRLVGVRIRDLWPRIVYAGLMLYCLGPSSIYAEGRVPVPEVPRGLGERCVEPTEVMRRDHMEFILHQRDETVHQGIRTKRHSLKECINCHVQPGPDGQYASIDSRQHFCNSCHSYTAVKIDCFECHASRPSKAAAEAQADVLIREQWAQALPATQP